MIMQANSPKHMATLLRFLLRQGYGGQESYAGRINLSSPPKSRLREKFEQSKVES